MLDAKKLLDALVGSAAASSSFTNEATEHSSASTKPSSPNAPAFGDVSDLLGSVIGQLTGSADGQPGSVAETGEDLFTQARQYLNTPQGRNVASAVAGGLAGLLYGSRLNKRSVTASAARLGGIALIGGLAYKAYQGWKTGQPAWMDASTIAEPPRDSAFGAEAMSQDAALVFMRAMIAAAASDGYIDAEERGRIFASLEKVGFQREAAQFLDREFANPASITQLASSAANEEQGVQIYTAARLAIEPDTEVEREFLGDLADALSLSPDLVMQLNTVTGAVKH